MEPKVDARHDRPSIQKRRVGHGIESMDAADCRHSSLTDAVGGGVGPCVRRRNSWRRFSAADLARRRVSPICMRGVVKITSSAVTNGERERQRGGGERRDARRRKTTLSAPTWVGVEKSHEKKSIESKSTLETETASLPPHPLPPASFEGCR